MLQGLVRPGVGGFLPGVSLTGQEVGEVEAAMTCAVGEVEERLGGSVKVEDGLHAVARPLDCGEALGLGVLEGADIVDEHGVEDGLFLGLLGAVARVEVAGDAFIFKDDGPGHGG